MPTLGAFIRRRRLELGLTQETLAEMIGGGVRQAEISRLGATLCTRDRMIANHWPEMPMRDIILTQPDPRMDMGQ